MGQAGIATTVGRVAAATLLAAGLMALPAVVSAGRRQACSIEAALVVK